MGKIVYYIYIFILLIFQAIKGLLLAEIESYQVDLLLLDHMYEEKKVKLSVILSMLGAIPLLLASVFEAKCSLVGKGNVAVQTAVIVCGISIRRIHDKNIGFGSWLYENARFKKRIEAVFHIRNSI